MNTLFKTSLSKIWFKLLIAAFVVMLTVISEPLAGLAVVSAQDIGLSELEAKDQLKLMNLKEIEVEVGMSLVEAEALYNQVKVADLGSLCSAERSLAGAKLVAYQRGEIFLAEVDLKRLLKKHKKICFGYSLGKIDVVNDSKLILAPSYYEKLNVDEDQNQYVRMASTVSNNDFDFILTMEAENGLWTPDRRHTQNRNGTYDFGFCGLNSRYHWNFIQSEEFKNPRKQIEYCYNIFRQKPYRFYGYYKRNRYRNRFVLKENIALK